MAVSRGDRVMMAQYNAAIKEEDDFIKYYMVEDKVRVWYVLLHGVTGDKDEFVGGEYLVRIEFPDKFPIEPPWFFFMTPNGVYNPETKVCINIGGYHKDQYRAALGARGFIKQLVSGLIGWETLDGGINLIDTTVKQKQTLANDSVLYNALNNAAWLCKINDAYKSYTAARKPVANNNNSPDASTPDASIPVASIPVASIPVAELESKTVAAESAAANGV